MIEQNKGQAWKIQRVLKGRKKGITLTVLLTIISLLLVLPTAIKDSLEIIIKNDGLLSRKEALSIEETTTPEGYPNEMLLTPSPVATSVVDRPDFRSMCMSAADSALASGKPIESPYWLFDPGLSISEPLRITIGKADELVDKNGEELVDIDYETVRTLICV